MSEGCGLTCGRGYSVHAQSSIFRSVILRFSSSRGFWYTSGRRDNVYVRSSLRMQISFFSSSAALWKCKCLSLHIAGHWKLQERVFWTKTHQWMEPSKQTSQPCNCICYMMCQKLDVLIIECCEYCWMCIVNVMFLENSLWVDIRGSNPRPGKWPAMF